ncbi:MAG: hypothetical protein O7C75_01070 [Verrucomicrobia bacterium]|nr:hypothetical protein [Verrucomicrobiota bacterium]
MEIFRKWSPLAASWLLMSAELPILSAVVARLLHPEVSLAAFGGVVFPIALVIESPIIMLLVASTALSSDWGSYQKLNRFMMWMGAGLTVIHAVIVFTPFYFVVAEQLIGAPMEVVGSARIGLAVMLPWSWAIGFRRFQQGVLIRFGHSQVVAWGTFIRLVSLCLVLAVGSTFRGIPGLVIATAAAALAVMVEAGFIWLKVRPVIRLKVRCAKVVWPLLTYRVIVKFYAPLALTTFCLLLVQPISTAAMSRMSFAFESLAVWPAVNGLIFVVRSLSLSFNEIVVSLIERENGYKALQKFSRWLFAILTVFYSIMALSSLGWFWLNAVSGLSEELSDFAFPSLGMALLIPGLGVWQSWHQGILVYYRRTSAISEAVLVFLLLSVAVMWGGVAMGALSGLSIVLLGITAGMIGQTFWQWTRCRSILKEGKVAIGTGA